MPSLWRLHIKKIYLAGCARVKTGKRSVLSGLNESSTVLWVAQAAAEYWIFSPLLNIQQNQKCVNLPFAKAWGSGNSSSFLLSHCGTLLLLLFFCEPLCLEGSLQAGQGAALQTSPYKAAWSPSACGMTARNLLSVTDDFFLSSISRFIY